MTLYAILGDIHANEEAFKAVIQDATKRGVTNFLSVGDLVGYGPRPKQCIALAREIGLESVLGNHDNTIVYQIWMSDINDIPRISLEWTDQQLSDEERSYLGQSGVVKVMDGFSLVHSSMRCPTEWRYIHGNNDAYWNHFSRLVNIQSKLILNKIRVCFIGHTHQAQAFSMKIPSNDDDLNNISTLHPPEGIGLPTLSGYWYLFNVGSVGQPRDGNEKACYVTFDDTVKEVTYHRVDYDIQKTQAQIRKAGLPERLAERLDFGK